MSGDLWFSLRLSLIVASSATLIVAFVGTAFGYLLARYRFWGKDILDTLLALPLVLPPTVVGYYLLGLLGKQGLHLLFTPQAAIVAASIMALPLMVRTSRAAIESVDPSYEQAAYTLGKSRFRTFLQVTLPLAWKGLMAGVVLSFARALGEFGATLMVAGNIPGKTQTMPLAIYEATQSGEEMLAFLLVAVLTTTAFGFLLITNRLTQSRPW
ncbi:MAG: molybdate ABC transporter permease subunit [Anaerolineae bacterium]|nr:molybdate ABC transporter permease subunit [Gloeobacterales cyanobacterium ES-bin-313]